MKQATRIWYSTDVDGHDSRYEIDMDGPEWDIREQIVQLIVAEAAASKWFHNGGYEASWPVEFALYETEDGPELARLDVDMEVEPRFYATQKRSLR